MRSIFYLDSFDGGWCLLEHIICIHIPHKNHLIIVMCLGNVIHIFLFLGYNNRQLWWGLCTYTISRAEHAEEPSSANSDSPRTPQMTNLTFAYMGHHIMSHDVCLPDWAIGDEYSHGTYRLTNRIINSSEMKIHSIINSIQRQLNFVIANKSKLELG